MYGFIDPFQIPREQASSPTPDPIDDHLAIINRVVGYGKGTIGGYGGTDYLVTKTVDDGTEGTLRYGLETLTGRRTISFDVSGILQLESGILVTEGFVSILGSTAPDKGVVLTFADRETFSSSENLLEIACPQVLLESVRFYGGNLSRQYSELSLSEADAGDVGFYQNDGLIIGRGACYVAVLNCQFGKCIDENLNVFGGFLSPHNITIQNCIIHDGLSNSTHRDNHTWNGSAWQINPLFDHNAGALIGNSSYAISFIGNALIGNTVRVPAISDAWQIELLGNIVADTTNDRAEIEINGGGDPDEMYLTSVWGNFITQLAFDTNQNVGAQPSFYAAYGAGVHYWEGNNIAQKSAAPTVYDTNSTEPLTDSVEYDPSWSDGAVPFPSNPLDYPALDDKDKVLAVFDAAGVIYNGFDDQMVALRAELSDILDNNAPSVTRRVTDFSISYLNDMNLN